MYDLLKALYKRSPRVVQEAYSRIPAAWRLGGHYRSELALVTRTLTGPYSELRAVQKERLRGVLSHSLSTVPFYREWAKGASVDFTDPFGLLRSLPMVDKGMLRDRPAEFRSDAWSRYKAFYTTTGGTSGRPFGFWIDNTAYAREWAYVHTVWGWFGYRAGARKATLRGIPFKEKPGQIHSYNPIYNELLLSPFEMTDSNLREYVKLMEDFKPEFLHGYPSALTILGRFLQTTGVKLPQIKAVFAVSENVYPGQREFLEQAFACPFQSFYGQSERVAFAAQCESGTDYHVFEQFGVVELVDGDGHVITEPGVSGEIVATGFLNSVMPFVRYRTGDYAEWDYGDCPCGRHLPRLRSLRGRWTQEMMIGHKDEGISVTALNVHSHAFDSVMQFRFVQYEKGKVQLLLVPGPTWSDSSAERIVAELKQKVGAALDFEVKTVTSLPLSPIGKAVFLEQHL